MTFFTDGTCSLGGVGATWEIKDSKLVITMGNNELVSSYDYYFSEDDTKLHLRTSGSDKYDIYSKQLD